MSTQIRLAKAATSETRREKIDGDEFVVVPMVALRTGVYQCANCQEPEFYDADIFARIPDSWNDRPVTLGHPQREGLFVSAGSQDVWQKEGLGRVRNARRDGTKLVMEAWIDLLKADDLGDTAAQLVDALEAGDQIDVSVGAFIDTVARPGTHQGKTFARTQTSYVPDHVAFLPGMTGACSWDDGCGAPRVNEAIEDDTMTLQVAQSVPPTPAAGNCDCGGGDGACTCHDHALAGVLQFKNQAIGDQARRRILSTALDEKLGRESFFMIVEVFDDTVIYEARGGVFSREFTISEDGTITLSDIPVQGALVAEFMPITVQQEKLEMTERKKAVDGLIANEAAPWSEGDREFLMKAGDDQFAKLQTNHQKAATDDDKGTDEFPKVEVEPAAAAAATAGQPAAMTAAEREVIDDALAERSRTRADLVTKIAANESNQFSKPELEAMDTGQLRKLAALSFADANKGRPASGNYAGAQPAVSTTDVKQFADRAPEPDWTKRAH